MRRSNSKQVPSEEEIKDVLPSTQPKKNPPMQGFRRLQSARQQSGMGNKMNNLLGLKARMSPYGGQNNNA